jgi:cyanophycinase
VLASAGVKTDRAHPTLVAAMLGLALSAAAAAAGPAAPRGHLLIIGGGERPPELIARIVELAGGAEARIAVIPSASSVPGEVGPAQAKELVDAGAGEAFPLHVTAEAARDPATREALEGVTGIFFSGGDQRRLTRALLDTPLLRALHEIYANGGVVSGTSAGAAIMGPLMITGDEKIPPPDDEEAFSRILADNVVTTAGLGFLEGVVVDQHFVARKRLNRLISVVLENPQLLGVGIDESTAILVDPDRTFDVLGRSHVVVLDASRVRDISAGPDGHLAGHGIVLHLLRAGERFDLETRQPLPR